MNQQDSRIKNNKMHTKYSKETLHNHQVRRFHDRNLLSRHKITQLTKIGNSFKTPIKLIQQKNQLIVQEYLSNNIDEHAQILTDNWLFKIYAYKNTGYITEDHKRYERYLIWKYKNNTKRRVNK